MHPFHCFHINQDFADFLVSNERVGDRHPNLCFAQYTWALRRHCEGLLNNSRQLVVLAVFESIFFIPTRHSHRHATRGDFARRVNFKQVTGVSVGLTCNSNSNAKPGIVVAILYAPATFSYDRSRPRCRRRNNRLSLRLAARNDPRVRAQAASLRQQTPVAAYFRLFVACPPRARAVPLHHLFFCCRLSRRRTREEQLFATTRADKLAAEYRAGG